MVKVRMRPRAPRKGRFRRRPDARGKGRPPEQLSHGQKVRPRERPAPEARAGRRNSQVKARKGTGSMRDPASEARAGRLSS